MKLNKNSISAKLFRWFYGTSELPTNLCPYFWKLVMAYVFVIPLFIISFPYIIIDKNSCNESLGHRIGLGFVCWIIFSASIVCLIAALSPIMLFWYTPVKGSFLKSLIEIGFAAWAGGLIIGVSSFIYYLGKKNKRKKKKKSTERRKTF